jgi:hypothetical protein
MANRSFENEAKFRDRECSMHREKRSEYRLLVGKPEERRPLGRHTHRWEDVDRMI